MKHDVDILWVWMSCNTIHLPWKHSSSGYPYPQQTCSEMLGDKTPVFNASFVAPCCEISYSFQALIMSEPLCLHSDAPRDISAFEMVWDLWHLFSSKINSWNGGKLCICSTFYFLP